MPMIKMSDHTLQLIREQTQEGFSFRECRDPPGRWTVGCSGG
jgi:hypothetical protein